MLQMKLYKINYLLKINIKTILALQTRDAQYTVIVSVSRYEHAQYEYHKRNNINDIHIPDANSPQYQQQGQLIEQAHTVCFYTCP